jgi:quinol monooxygenase YgiN
MMSVSAIAAFACAVLAAVGTGVLAGRCIRAPRTDIIAWTFALAALTVALAAQGYGASHGYGSATFRAVQFGAQLIAPLWLAWGLVELAGKGVAVRFGAKLVNTALTVVGGVVLVTDPLSSTGFSKSWPPASAHYQIIPRTLLGVFAVVTLATVVTGLIVSLVRLRTDPFWRRPVIAITAAGVAAVLILGLRLKLPAGTAYVAVCAVCAALTWFAGVWADKIGLAELHGEGPPGRAGRGGRPLPRDEESATDEEITAAYTRPAKAGGRRRAGDDDGYRPAREYQPNGGYAQNGDYRHDGGSGMNGLERGDRGTEPDDGFEPDDGQERDSAAAGFADADRSGIWRPKTPGGPGALPGTGALPADGALPGTGVLPGSLAGAAALPGDGALAPNGRLAAGEILDLAATQRLYGLIAIYTLAEGAAPEFDALAERVVEDVRASEPDALVYAVHSVPNAAMQRIFYEVYRDRMAYEDHQRQPHIRRFEADRGAYVLATNVIELGMQQAKLSPLPGLSPLFDRAPGA